MVANPLVNQLPVLIGSTGKRSCTDLTPNISSQNTNGQATMLLATDSLLKRDRARTSALVAGLAATVASWTLAAAFASERLGSLSSYSPWFYGPVAIAAWVLFGVIAHLLLMHGRDRRTSLDLHEGYRCPELAMFLKSNGHSLWTNENEQTRLGAITAGFALTITAWVGVLSFMPEDWIDWLANSPPWICCAVSMVLWSTLSAAMFLAFRRSSERSG